VTSEFPDPAQIHELTRETFDASASHDWQPPLFKDVPSFSVWFVPGPRLSMKTMFVTLVDFLLILWPMLGTSGPIQTFASHHSTRPSKCLNHKDH
jgi:hypothetical protein